MFINKDRFLFLSLAIILLFVLVITYSNHFNNDFHFDDYHTIVDNPYIRSLKNIPDFFTNPETFSTLRGHQSYRPIVSTTVALDYWIGKGPNPFYFHLSVFILYVIQCILLYLLISRIYKTSWESYFTKYIALFATALYALHPANAETINYIIARSDSISTLMILASLVIYIYLPNHRKYLLYLIPTVIGILTKETVAVFPVLLFLYVYLFEKRETISNDNPTDPRSRLKESIIKCIPALIVTVIFSSFSYFMSAGTFISGGASRFEYLITQPFVILHYFLTFFLPVNLSADSDWQTFSSIWDDRVIVGLLFILTLLYFAIRSSKNSKYHPLTFGIIWFLIALAPTSSIIPLAEVMNDHRTFFPFIGLTIAISWAIGIVVLKNAEKVRQGIFLRGLLIGSLLAVVIAYSYLTFQRNNVWRNEESLWQDVTIKSPKNGRGLMNYGLVLMRKGDYHSALTYFEEAYKLIPYYPNLLINLGIINNTLGNSSTAEEYFKLGIYNGANDYEPYFYYARFLLTQNRLAEAEELLNKAIELGQSYLPSRHLLLETYRRKGKFSELDSLAKLTSKLFPDDSITLTYTSNLNDSSQSDSPYINKKNDISLAVDSCIELSLMLFNNMEYQRCIELCHQALQLNPNSAEAYNNMCCAYNALGNYKEAIKAGKKALEINPNFELARNNVKWAESMGK